MRLGIMTDQTSDIVAIATMTVIAACAFKAFRDYHRRSSQPSSLDTEPTTTPEINSNTPPRGPDRDNTDSI